MSSNPSNTGVLVFIKDVEDTALYEGYYRFEDPNLRARLIYDLRIGDLIRLGGENYRVLYRALNLDTNRVFLTVQPD